MKILTKEQRIGDIVTQYPESARIFNNLKIDYCCHGDQYLEKVLKEKGINVFEFLENLNNKYKEFLNSKETYIDWKNENPLKLIDNIIKQHHHFTFKELDEIDQLLLKVFSVHYQHSSAELKSVYKLFCNLKAELEGHLIKEEEELFPMIKEYLEEPSVYLRDEIMKMIGVIEYEHTVAGEILQSLYRETNGYNIPDWGCTTYKLVYDKLDNLEKDLFIHIHKENSILFKLI
ncbi:MULTISPECIES: iron-sulfur cluster repair di-iron protein [unclassified Clostridioides]|uniref:iron-sulfur cluster repair di-iron protein n=1 Tax=unclassified Clostridioides TaxID=2635829 RepID=UPI0038AE8398